MTVVNVVWPLTALYEWLLLSSMIVHGQLIDTMIRGDYDLLQGDIMAEMEYPIRAVSKLTGLSIDTLRAWERRYEAVRPRRDDRGRLYSEVDIRRLQLLRTAVERGHAIGRIAHLTNQQVESLLSRSALPDATAPEAALPETGPAAAGLACILEAVGSFDARRADAELGRMALLLPPKELVLQIALPLMRSVGDGWQCGRISIAQEHLVSAMLRNLLGTVMRQSSPQNPEIRLLFATPSGELHEFGILAAALMAGGGGFGVVYLGPNLPAEEIAHAAEGTGSRVVVLSLTGSNEIGQAIHNLNLLLDSLPENKEVWVGGARPADLRRAIADSRAIMIRDFEHFAAELKRLHEQ